MKSWWTSLTSSNRHAESKRSPYNPSFTSIRTGLNTDSVSSLTKNPSYSSYDVSSPSSSQVNLNTGYSNRREGAAQMAMPMQDFQDGVAPPPPVADSWRRIDRWTEENYPELYDQLTYGASGPDVDELEHELEMNLPGDVRESFYIHDGQERGGRPTGLFFGVALLDCEELVDEYNLWKKVAASLPRPSDYPSPLIGSSRPNGLTNRQNSSPTAQARKPVRRMKQVSRPEGAIQLVYAHPGWVPLAKDYQGNNIAIDLSPGPQGRVGQVILYGRDYDTKYVVAPTWAAFLASFVSDLESDNVVVDDDVGVGGEMGLLRFLIDPDKPDQQHTYLEILRARVIRRDRAMKGPSADTNSSTPSLIKPGTRRNGKGKAQGLLKGSVNERLPRSNLGINGGLPARSITPLSGPVINGHQKEESSAGTAPPIISAVESEETSKPGEPERQSMESKRISTQPEVALIETPLDTIEPAMDSISLDQDPKQT